MYWEQKYEVGHEKIDFEHRIFFDLIQSVIHASEEGASRNRLRRILAETEKYAEFHFLSEENIMIDVGFPDYEDHRAHHRALIRELATYIIDFETGKMEITALAAFLTKWFVAHTTIEDKELSKYIACRES
jgi:hemerythrin